MAISKEFSQIRLFLLDMDGTFTLGSRLTPGALDFIAALGRLGCGYMFLTNNSSRNRRQYADKITSLGLTVSPDKIFTSGEAACLYLQKKYPSAAVYAVGTPALEEELGEHGFRLEEKSPQAVLLGFDTAITYEKLWKLCDFVRAGLPYIATHPDLNCPIENGFMPDTGAVIAFVQASTGRRPDVVIGKPNRMLLEMLSAKLGVPIPAMAMVGDRLYTDIALGKEAGIRTCLVLTGETRRKDLANSFYQPDFIFENLGELGQFLENRQKNESSEA